MSDNAPPPIPSDGPPPIPQDGLGELGLNAPPAVPNGPPPYASPALQPAAPRIANPGLRALAFLLDGIGTFIITTVIIFLGLGVGEWEVFNAMWLVPLLSAALSTILTATVGATPGKAIVGLKVVHVATGGPIGAWSILRSLVIVAPIALPFVITVVFDALFYGPLSEFRYSTGLYDWVGLVWSLPLVGWIVLLLLLILRPNHRGLEDLAGRSVVVYRRG